MKNADACPIEIINAIKIWIVNYFIGFALLVIYWDELLRLYGSTPSLLTSQIFTATFYSWIYYKIYKGKKWARTTWLASTILGILLFFYSTLNFISLLPSALKIHAFFSVFINIAYIFIFFLLPSSRIWFSKNSTQPEILYGTEYKTNSEQTPTIKMNSLTLSISNNDTLIDEKYWGIALEEFEGKNRKIGLYAQCYANANGDEIKIKVEYLRRRAAELSLA